MYYMVWGRMGKYEVQGMLNGADTIETIPVDGLFQIQMRI